MKERLGLVLILGLAILAAFGIGVSHIALAASPTGVYDILEFPGASEDDCGSWAVYSSEGVTQPGPSVYVETMTDAYGNVIYSRSQSGAIGTFPFWGSGIFTTDPVANPIREHIVMDGVVIADIFANNPCVGDAVYQGAPIPTGFELRTITCDTVVYDAAGGSPLVTGEKVTAGQTWYVNLTPKAVGGTNWTEIFNNGRLNGYIPTSCVAG